VNVARGSGHFVTSGRETTPEEQAAAVRQVQRNARDRDDLRLLLDALGLDEPSQPPAADEPTAKRRSGRPPVDHGHGDHRTYSKGCRCTPCREANREKCAERRANWSSDPAAADRAGHGNASTYKNYGCRCDLCSQANSEAVREYRSRRGRRQRQLTA